MVYDCFIFNSELDLLNLRLSFLNDTVDYFVIVESEQTLAGNLKPLYYKSNEHLFKKYAHKIIHLIAPQKPGLSAWDYEYFQRNFIKEGLKNCKDDDLILISDVDEIVNLKSILALKSLQTPCLIELPYYYYFFNLKAHKTFKVNLLSPYSFIKNLFIGERNKTYKKYVENVVKKEDCKTGWHFSYLFGFDMQLYVEKISSFSHQEFNNPYFLNENRIKKCIQIGVDLFEREQLLFSFKAPEKDMKELLTVVKELRMEQLIYQPGITHFFKADNFSFFCKKKVKPFLKNYLYTLPRYKIIVATSPFRKRIGKVFTNRVKIK